MMINVGVVEDEDSAAETLSEYFERYSHEKGAQFHIVRFDNPVNFLTNYKSKYDLVLMDIDLPDMDGMEASRRMREIDNLVTLIFVTNLSQYAVYGYEVNAFDYVVKPVSYFDFALKLERAVKRIENRDLVRIPIPIGNDAGGGIRLVIPSEIKYVEVINHKLIYHTTNGNFETTGSLKELENKLAAFDFAKCNNCYLVNLAFVTALNGFTVVVGDDELQVSHPRRKEFRRALNDYLGEEF